MEQLQKIQKKLTEITVSTAALNCLVGHMLNPDTDIDALTDMLTTSADMIENIADQLADTCDTLCDAVSAIVDTTTEDCYE